MSLRLSGGRRLQSPPGLLARPTPARVRQAILQILAGRLAGSRWLDLCCGSGVMACEALQWGAVQVEAVERDRRVAAVARANLEAVASGLPGEMAVRVHSCDVLTWLRRGVAASQPGQRSFDLIYCDPPYRAGLYAAIASAVAEGAWLDPEGLLLWECASDAAPEVPSGWVETDRRRYGGTSVILLAQQP